MLKLIRSYQINPSRKNAERLRDYMRKHPMAQCMLAVNETDALHVALLHAETVEA